MAQYEWLDAYLCEKNACVKEYKEEWKSMRYLVGGKQFAYAGGDKEGKDIITLKLEPLHGEMLREQYEDIVPGYYANKLHWNSVYLDGAVPDDVLRDMIDESYQLVFASLTKKLQSEIAL